MNRGNTDWGKDTEHPRSGLSAPLARSCPGARWGEAAAEPFNRGTQANVFAAPFLVLIALAFLMVNASVHAGSTHPYYRRRLPAPQEEANFLPDHIDLGNVIAHLPSYPNTNTVSNYTKQFDARAAAVIRHAVNPQYLRVFPDPNIIWQDDQPHFKGDDGTINDKAGDGLVTEADLLEMKWYDDAAPTIYTVTSKALPALAYRDYFPDTIYTDLTNQVSQAIMAAAPGWCGTFGPKDSTLEIILGASEGNYDMTEMHLIPIVYAYYDELSPDARERLITQLLAYGRIHRPNEDDVFTAGGVPDDWTRAGYFGPSIDIGPIPVGVKLRTIDETENHILMIQTAKYLCNQLLYQRDHLVSHDNRRNGSEKRYHSMDLILELLGRILRDDFSEYNAKPYSEETRWALLNLCSYAYDQEVRLAARMVLDYISAHLAVSTSDAGRMVPFRRRNEGPRNSTIGGGDGPMSVALVDSDPGGDPLLPYLAIQTGNLRSFEFPHYEIPPDRKTPARPWPWAIADGGQDLSLEAISDYRVPPMILDLFLNDSHRRFFQRLRRTARDEAGGNRNCDNMEIYAGSASYLISAGGQPATWAIDPTTLGVDFTSTAHQQIGFAVTTSFMPNGLGPGTRPDRATGLIQFGAASSTFDPNAVENYGVAPDFACGYSVYLPLSVARPEATSGNFSFFDRAPLDKTLPGYYLAIYKEPENGFALLEAYDTQLLTNLTFAQFQSRVLAQNGSLHLQSNVEADYTTQSRNHLHFVIWNHGERNNTLAGTRVLSVDGESLYRYDSEGNAGNDTSQFLNGTVLRSPAEGKVEISNHYLTQSIILDMSDIKHPARTSENGETEYAGYNNEVWVDFDWTGPFEGDFYHPFNSLAAAVAAVADYGVIRVMPGSTHEKPNLKGKHVKIIAPIGDVHVGLR